MGPIRAYVRRHRIGAFVFLAYAISWSYWIPMALRGEVVTAGGRFSHFPGLAGPLVAAVIVTALDAGWRGLAGVGRSLVRWRVPRVQYLAALLPLIVFLVLVAVESLADGRAPSFAGMNEYSGVPTWPLLLVVAAVLVGAVAEEAGWRGFLTPALLEGRSPLAASAIVAVVWFGWHLPLFWVIETYHGMGIAVIPMMGIGLFAGSIVLTWLYRASGSILIVALWHASLNLGSATAPAAGLAGVVLWNFVLLWAIAIVARARPARSSAPRRGWAGGTRAEP